MVDTPKHRKEKQSEDKVIPQVPFDEALKRMLSTPPKQPKKAPKKTGK